MRAYEYVAYAEPFQKWTFAYILDQAQDLYPARLECGAERRADEKGGGAH